MLFAQWPVQIACSSMRSEVNMANSLANMSKAGGIATKTKLGAPKLMRSEVGQRANA